MKKKLLMVALISAAMGLVSCNNSNSSSSTESSPSVSESVHSSEESVVSSSQSHTYAKPTYAWAEDNSTCTATRVCEDDPDLTETETAHTAYTVIEPATCEEEGKGVYDAAFENPAFAAQSKDVTIPKLGHEYIFSAFDWDTSVAGEYSAEAVYVCAHDEEHVIGYPAEVSVTSETEATCSAAGERTYTATYDGHTDTKTETIPALEHDYGEPTYEWSEDYSKCTAKVVCNDSEEHVLEVTADSTFTYSEGNKGNFTVSFDSEYFEAQTSKEFMVPTITVSQDDAYVSGDGGVSGDVYIPDTYSDLPVKQIGSMAFKGIHTISSVIVGKNVEKVAGGAFEDSSISSFVVTEGSALTALSNEVFNLCTSLNKVSFGKSSKLSTVGDSIFSGCSSLSSITFPASLSRISRGTFNGARLSYITFESGCLLKELPSRLFTPLGMTLTSVRFEQGCKLEKIVANAFKDDVSLTEVHLPASLTAIEENIFSNCGALTSLSFEGTMEQWEAISKNSKWNQNSSIGEIICSDGEIRLAE